MNLFGLGVRNRKVNPVEISRGIRSGIELCLTLSADKQKKNTDELVERLTQSLALLPTATSKESEDATKTQELQLSLSARDDVVDSLVTALIADDLLLLIPLHLPKFSFEPRRLLTQLFCSLFAAQEAESKKRPAVEYILAHAEVIDAIMNNYDKNKIATNMGKMLRSCAVYAELVRYALELGTCNRLVDLVQQHNFDVSSDAFISLRELLINPQKSIPAQFIDDHFDEFFAKFWEILNTDNYVTVRQSLKLLSELLLDRAYLRPMLKYVRNEKFLMLHMEQLRNDSKAIAFEAFHLFKIFVANPQKPHRVHKILYSNRDKLIRFLHNFLIDRDEEQFLADKVTILQKLETLVPPPLQETASSSSTAQQPATLAASLAVTQATTSHSGDLNQPMDNSCDSSPSITLLAPGSSLP